MEGQYFHAHASFDVGGGKVEWSSGGVAVCFGEREEFVVGDGGVVGGGGAVGDGCAVGS